MKILSLAFAVLLFSLPANADDLADNPNIPVVNYPALVAKAPDASGFVPAGWKLDLERSGDLNGDGLADLMLVLIDADPKNIISDPGHSDDKVDSNPRMLAVAFADKSGGFSLALQNHTLIPRITDQEFEDPLQKDGTLISKGSMTLAFYSFGSAIWQPTLQFRYQHGHFELIGYEDSSADRFSGTTTGTSINYITRKMEITTGTISDDATKTVTKRLKPAGLLRLEDLKSGLDFDGLRNQP